MKNEPCVLVTNDHKFFERFDATSNDPLFTNDIRKARIFDGFDYASEQAEEISIAAEQMVRAAYYSAWADEIDSLEIPSLKELGLE